jgi:hypothetical protein
MEKALAALVNAKRDSMSVPYGKTDMIFWIFPVALSGADRPRRAGTLPGYDTRGNPFLFVWIISLVFS